MTFITIILLFFVLLLVYFFVGTRHFCFMKSDSDRNYYDSLGALTYCDGKINIYYNNLKLDVVDGIFPQIKSLSVKAHSGVAYSNHILYKSNHAYGADFDLIICDTNGSNDRTISKQCLQYKYCGNKVFYVENDNKMYVYDTLNNTTEFVFQPNASDTDRKYLIPVKIEVLNNRVYIFYKYYNTDCMCLVDILNSETFELENQSNVNISRFKLTNVDFQILICGDYIVFYDKFGVDLWSYNIKSNNEKYLGKHDFKLIAANSEAIYFTKDYAYHGTGNESSEDKNELWKLNIQSGEENKICELNTDYICMLCTDNYAYCYKYLYLFPSLRTFVDWEFGYKVEQIAI